LRNNSQYSSDLRYKDAKNEIPRFNEDVDTKSRISSFTKTKRHGGVSQVSKREQLDDISYSVNYDIKDRS
jgi:hypothetical protein